MKTKSWQNSPNNSQARCEYQLQCQVSSTDFSPTIQTSSHDSFLSTAIYCYWRILLLMRAYKIWCNLPSMQQVT